MSNPDSSKRSQTNWAVVDAQTDADLQDPDNPPLDDRFWAEAVFVPGRKRQVTLRLDPDVLEFFRAQGPGYQRRINAVLRQYMNAVRHSHKR
ncbi:MAG: BrnA antitoxin family protein [Firmicutes bacterium]|nr:BrnA antitoxin family protein [Bacillota bacterium]